MYGEAPNMSSAQVEVYRDLACVDVDVDEDEDEERGISRGQLRGRRFAVVVHESDITPGTNP